MTISPIVDDQVADDDRFGMDLADRMTKALRHSGIGVQEMADYLEVSRNAVSSWINGRNEPRRRDLRAFALRTGYPMSWLEKGKRAPLDLSPDAEGLDSVTRHYRPIRRFARVAGGRPVASIESARSIRELVMA